jgi:N-acetylmuramoyl-L-alanine amidase
MVCSPRIKRILSVKFAALLLFCGGFSTESVWARSSYAATAAQLGIVSVRMNPNGSGLILGADRAFTNNETQNVSLLRLPSPYRVVLDIPNTHLATSQKVFPINHNGIDRIELSDSSSPFYSAVRVIVYVSDSQTLSHIAPVFDGSNLRLEGLSAVALNPSQLTTFSYNNAIPVPLIGESRRNSSKKGQNAQPLPPVVAAPVFSMMKQPPVPPVQVVASATATEKLGLNNQTVLGAVPAGASVVEDVEFRDNKLLIKAGKGADLHVKNRFVLTAPSRLVLDIDNAVLASKALMNPISGSAPEMQQMRVGQFDEKTVRIVIQSTTPEQFESIYPGSDRNILAITPYSSTSISKLSANTRLGEIQSIDLKRENGSTILRLTASAPIVHRFLKKDDRIILDLLNEASHPTPIGFDQKIYPEIDKMRLEPLTDGQPNSKLSIKLINPNMRVVPTISEDGRVMELLIAADNNGNGTAINALANLAGLGAAGKAPFAARIVVDAGHGGKDNGANRSGVNEKDLNLSLALMLRDALTEKGFKVYMTRSTDVFLPLPQITAITNQIQPDLFISIHHNASVNPALAGIETYYFTPQSVPLARRVHAREINSVGVRDGGVKHARFYVIHHTAVPAILCEVGYVSNPSELTDLQSTDRKLKTARSIADGVVDYLKTRVSAKAR